MGVFEMEIAREAVCNFEGVTTQQTQDIVIRYLEAQPEVRHGPLPRPRSTCGQRSQLARNGARQGVFRHHQALRSRRGGNQQELEAERHRKSKLTEMFSPGLHAVQRAISRRIISLLG